MTNLVGSFSTVVCNNGYCCNSVLVWLLGVEEFSAFDVKAPISLVTDGNGYHGLVEEGATIVNVTPAIKIEKTDEHELLCNIFILQDGVRDDNSPFEVTWLRFQEPVNLNFSRLFGRENVKNLF